MHTVIVGGGFAGVKAALEIGKKQLGKVTLISDVPYFLHHATLYATATGKSNAESVIPLSEIFAEYHNVTVVLDSMSDLDTRRKLVIGVKKHYSYDTLIIAIGSVTTFFNINGLAKHAFGIKSLREVSNFNDHIKDDIANGKHLDKNYFVIGAGPTGVELAGALHEYLTHLKAINHIPHDKIKVTLVEAAPSILPRASKTAQRIVGKRLRGLGIRVLTSHKVESLDESFITIDGKKVPTETAIWTSGVANHPFFTTHTDLFDLGRTGRVEVDHYLRTRSGIYVIGDNNTVKFSGMAWPAFDQAEFVASHIARVIARRPLKAFSPKQPPSGLPVGNHWGYVEWRGIYVAGLTGFAARRLMELYGYLKLVRPGKAIATWRAHDIDQIDS